MSHPEIVSFVHAAGGEPAHFLIVQGSTMLRITAEHGMVCNLMAETAEHLRRVYSAKPRAGGDA